MCVCVCVCVCVSDVTIGLERTSTTVDEDAGIVEVCASVQGPVELQRSVRVVLSTRPGTALGNCRIMILTYT